MNESNEISINFKDYLLYTFRRWRGMLLVGALFAILIGGGYIGYKLANWDAAIDEYNAQVDAYHESLNEYEQNAIEYDAVINYESNRAKATSEYIGNSVYFWLNYEDVLITRADIYIQLKDETSDKTDTIRLYKDGITQSIDWSKIGGDIGLDERYIRELVEIEIDYDADIIGIKLLYPDEKVANDIIQRIMDDAADVNSDLKSIAPFDVYVYNQHSYHDRVLDVYENRNETDQRYLGFLDKINSAQKSLEELIEPQPPKMIRRIYILPKAIIFAVIGFIIGIIVFMVCCYYRYVNSGIIYSANEFSRISGFNNLGVFKRNLKKSFFIDRKIEIGASDYTEEDDEEVIDKIDFNVRRLIKGEESILLIGVVDDERLHDVSEKLSAKLGNVDITATSDINNDIDNIKMLSDVDKVILISEREKTSLDDLFKTINLVKQYDKEIIGNIVI